jgi:hypothetical protein
LLFGRAAAGGGGGAYVNSLLTTVPASTLNVLVARRVFLGVGGTSTSGNSSTIVGYEASFFATGGSGGGANNSDTTPPGASPGGTTTASAGTIKIAGGAGGKGASALLSLGLSSGAGGAGANSGGAGGASVPSTLFNGNAYGKDGSIPGGGGSGAINSAGGTIFYGGAGAAGRVIISYNCPTYSLTGVTAVTCSNGSGALYVLLTSSPASLPVGNYVITYNRTNPSATGLTANVTVTTAGTGTFSSYSPTYPNQINSSTITITKITSESCSYTITTNNTAIVKSAISGTISVVGGSTICEGSTDSYLILSGNQGPVSRWEYSNSSIDNNWIDVPYRSSTNIYASLGKKEYIGTTSFRAVSGCGERTPPITVTVIEAPYFYLPITYDIAHENSSSAQNIAIPPQFSASAYIGYSVEWYDFNTGTEAPSSIIPNQNFTPLTFNSSYGLADKIVIPGNIPDDGNMNYIGHVYMYNTTNCKSLNPFYINLNIDGSSSKIGSEKDVNASTIATSLVPIATKDLETAENKISVSIVNKAINVDAYNRNINKVFIYDISGNLLYKKEAVSGSKLIIDNLRSSNQVLLVKVISDDNYVETKKVIY